MNVGTPGLAFILQVLMLLCIDWDVQREQYAHFGMVQIAGTCMLLKFTLIALPRNWTKCLNTPNFAEECSNFGHHALAAHASESSVHLSCGTEINDFGVTAYSDHRAQIHRVNYADYNDIVHMATQNMSIQSACQHEVPHPENKSLEIYSQLFESQPDTKSNDCSHHSLTRQQCHVADLRNNYNAAFVDSNTGNRSCSEHVC